MIQAHISKTVRDRSALRSALRKTVRERAVLVLGILACGSVACGNGGIAELEGVDDAGSVSSSPLSIGQVSQPIVGGETDREHSAVLAIALVTRREEALCTGSLIAPNLVLTARHCVAVTESEKVDCSDSTFGRLYAPGNLWVSSATSVGSSSATFYPVREIAVPEEGELCGSDIALMILDGQFRETSVAPLAPRLDQPARRGESFTAVGFGDALEDGAAGIRRALDGLQVVCGPSDCNAPALLTQREFVGEQGVCDGDSGGPALDSAGRVVGVASRATEDCGLAVYSAVSPWRDWIVSVAEDAYDQGNYDTPDWLAEAEAADGEEVASADPGRATNTNDLAAGNDGDVSINPDTDLTPTRKASGCSLAQVGSAPNGNIDSRNPLSPIALAALALAGTLRLRRRR